MLVIYCLELFPSSVRNSAMSMLRQAVNVGAIVSPVIVVIGHNAPYLSFAIFGIVIIMSSLFVVGLPETKDRPFYDTLEVKIIHLVAFMVLTMAAGLVGVVFFSFSAWSTCSSFKWGSYWNYPQSKTFSTRNKKLLPITTRAEASSRQTWLPGLEPPPYLDGSLVGDYGFDPFDLGKDPKILRWYVQAELIHARFAMAGVAGILFTDLLHLAGLKNIPLWYEVGASKFEFASTETLSIVQIILMGFVESKRCMDFLDLGSQAMMGTFLGLELALEGLENGYPGGPLFIPMCLAQDGRKSQPLKLKEIKKWAVGTGGWRITEAGGNPMTSCKPQTTRLLTEIVVE
ncbi:hypothetical protein KI387_031937 [Taxus chinensis]|uniref:Chlorophyll a-b binding protein, chloroplastic n=1 Tax=Taxus chinensis TaxID=29808 RepID=A0AA38BN56_TAXCH|nr:hypothetical protein KI387_031937 [Taxus chinensis]